MKIYRHILLILIIVGFVSAKGFSQQNYTQRADESFQLQEYYDAIALYKKAYTKVKNKAEKSRILFQTAECYRKVNDMKQAEVWFKKVVKAKYEDPIATLYYADALKANEKYEDAQIQYNAYKELAPADIRGANGAESCALAQKWLDNPTRYEVANLKTINAKERDFGATYGDKKYKSLIFTSAREGSQGSDYDSWTGENFTDLFVTTIDKKGAWSTPIPFTEPLNSKSNEGAASLNDKANTIYFTRCLVEKKKRLNCQIYSSKKKGQAWDEPELIPLGSDSFSYQQPSISDDELSLYFASNMPGGQGGGDIWVAKRSKKTKPFDNPINLGPTINSPGNEMFPYIRDDANLYFSSDYWIGLGGLDIFKSEKTGANWGAPVNMKFPVNSPQDDFAIIFEGKNEKGFFSSNRKGGKGNDDLYSLYLPPILFTLQGVVKDDSTKLIIPGAAVKLVGSDGTSITDTTDITGTYKFDNKQILENTSYQLTVTKDKYFSAKGKETTVGLDRSKDLVHDFYLVPIPRKPIELPEILYDLAKWNLKPQYQDSLNGLYQTLSDNPSLVIELQSHTDFRSSAEYNDTLSQKRAQSVVDFLVSAGIERDRMVAKGYGERVPRIVEKDLEKDDIKFPKGTVLSESYINGLKSVKEKEAAHSLNRRTQFIVLSDNYVPKTEIDTTKTPIKIEVITDLKADSLATDSIQKAAEKEKQEKIKAEQEKELKLLKEKEDKEKKDPKNKGNTNPKNNNKGTTTPKKTTTTTTNKGTTTTPKTNTTTTNKPK